MPDGKDGHAQSALHARVWSVTEKLPVNITKFFFIQNGVVRVSQCEELRDEAVRLSLVQVDVRLRSPAPA